MFISNKKLSSQRNESRFKGSGRKAYQNTRYSTQPRQPTLLTIGFSATAIADRVGHESIDITYNYAHLFPSTQDDMADKLNNFRKEAI